MAAIKEANTWCLKLTSHFQEPVPGHQAFGDSVKDQMRCPKVNGVQLELQEGREDLDSDPTIQRVSWQDLQHPAWSMALLMYFKAQYSTINKM